MTKEGDASLTLGRTEKGCRPEPFFCRPEPLFCRPERKRGVPRRLHVGSLGTFVPREDKKGSAPRNDKKGSVP